MGVTWMQIASSIAKTHEHQKVCIDKAFKNVLGVLKH